jgi:hypothetical protein
VFQKPGEAGGCNIQFESALFTWRGKTEKADGPRLVRDPSACVIGGTIP